METIGDIWALNAAQRQAALDDEVSRTSRWIACRTRGGREEEARRNAEAQLFVCWLPLVRDERGRTNLLFPGFMFVLVRRRWMSLLGTRGVSSVVMSGDKPGRLTERDLRWLREHQDEAGVVVLHEPVRFRAGDRVTVRAGRATGLSGLYECSTSRERCWILLGVLGGARVEISEDDIEASVAPV